ncbi:MAG TPA: response regulator [Streptosporangiaceae bacterium]
MFSVLVVEDNDVIARLLARCVSENRWLDLAGVAATEQEAITMARRVRPDLVLLDFGLSAPMAGFDVWHILQGLDEEPDVIAVTAAGDMSIVEKARKRGAFGYVVKPFTCATIQTKLADYTSFRRSVMAVPRLTSQSTIDQRLNPRHRSCSLPAGLLPETRDSIIAALRAADRALRASEIAERAGVERGTANRYLTYLCDQRIAERVPEHGRPGHPAYLYTLSPIWADPPDNAV